MTREDPDARSEVGGSAPHRRTRRYARWGVLIAALALAWPGRTESSASVVLPALGPFVAATSALAIRTIGIVAALSVPVLLLSLAFPRWFCRHACPTGFLQENLQRLRPRAPRPSRRVPKIGQGIVAIAVGGACLGYPWFLWLDPLALFQGFFNSWRQPLNAATVAAGVGLPLLLLFDFVFPRLWCRNLCPLGATQELLAWPRLRLGPRVQAWIQERIRERARRTEGPPPDTGSQVAVAGREDPSGLPLARRLFLGGCAGAAGALFTRGSRVASPPPLRPPGAIDEARFTGVCVRCGNCAQACPSRVIQPDFGGSGLAGLLTPHLRFRDDYCREDCRRCGQVCPSGAIARSTLEEKRRRVIGVARIDLEACLLAQGRECTACLRSCPYEALHMRSADGGFSNEPWVDPARCTGCGACEAVCPVRPHPAIRVAASPA